MTIQDQITAAANRYGVPPEIALSVAWRESRFDQAARGKAGEVGAFQLMPGTAADLKVNPYNLSENIDGGVRYLREQFDSFGDWSTALAAYNAGPGRVGRGVIPESTSQYVSEMLAQTSEYVSGVAAGVVEFVEDIQFPGSYRVSMFQPASPSAPEAAAPPLLVFGSLAIGAVALLLLLRR